MSKLILRLIVVLLALAGVLAVLWLALSRRPAFEPVADDALRIAAGDTLVNGHAIQPFRAVYRRRSKVLGVPGRASTGTLLVEATTAGEAELLQATIGLGVGNAVQDRIVLERGTLSPLGRRYDIPPGRSATLVFEGSRVGAQVTSGDSVVQDTSFTFERPVFEVSVLELVLGALPLEKRFSAHISWDNFVDSRQSWAQVRVVDRERITAGDGRAYDTWVVHVRFASGKVRALWIAEEPPYKIRLVNYLNGHAVVSRWELVRSEQ